MAKRKKMTASEELYRKISKEKVARGNDAIKLGTFYIILTFLLYILAIYQYTIGK